VTAQDRSSTDLHGADSTQNRSVGGTFVSVADAARRLGVSTATVKRRIRDGTLEAEPLSRPQGIEYRVRLPLDVPAPLTVPIAAPASDMTGPLSERSDSEQPPLSDGAHVTTQDASAAITAAIVPLVDRLSVADRQLAAQAETIRAQSEAIAELREDRGRLTAELAAARAVVDELRAAQAQQEAHQTTEAVRTAIEPSTPWWRRWLLAVYG
jgi:hypothetical protein